MDSMLRYIWCLFGLLVPLLYRYNIKLVKDTMSDREDKKESGVRTCFRRVWSERVWRCLRTDQQRAKRLCGRGEARWVEWHGVIVD